MTSTNQIQFTQEDIDSFQAGLDRMTEPMRRAVAGAVILAGDYLKRPLELATDQLVQQMGPKLGRQGMLDFGLRGFLFENFEKNEMVQRFTRGR